MKKLLSAILSLALCAGMTACSMTPPTAAAPSTSPSDAGSTTASTTATKKEPTMKVGFILPTLQSEFFVVYSNGVKEGLAKLGYEVIITSFDGDTSKAISAIETFTIQNVDCIIAMVADKGCDPALKAAMDKGIKVLVSGVETDSYDVCMLADNADVGKQIGEMAAEFINTKHGGKTKVFALIAANSNADMALRSTGMLEALKQNAPDAELVGTANYVNPGDATNAMENALQQNPDIKVVMCYGDAGSIEMVNALKAAGKTGDEYAAFGCDCTSEALKMINSNDMFRGSVDMGDIVSQTTELATSLLKDEISPLPYKHVGENKKVTTANISEYIK